MQELAEHLQKAVNYTNFYLFSLNNTLLDHASPEKIRKFYEQGKGLCFFYKVECRKDILNTLVDYLDEKLREYVNEECNSLVGYGLGHVTNARRVHNVKEIALLVIRAAVLLTPVKAAEIFSSWLNKQPLRYKIVGLLNGISLEKPLSLDGGIEVSEVSESLHRLSKNDASAPFFGSFQNQYFKGVALSIDVETSPALYKVQNSDALQFKQVKHTWRGNGYPFNFCEALSLSCDHLIYLVNMWKDGRDIMAFSSGMGFEIGMGFSITSFPQLLFNSHIKNIPTKPLSQKLLNDAWKIYSRRSDTSTNFLDVSIKRWLKSKQHNSSIKDRFIELRIALEALYLSGDSQRNELRFRLGTRGAFYLGKNSEERKRYYKILLDAYDVASKVIHGKEKEIDLKNQELFKDAQNLCRMGILKMLFQGQPNWNEVIFK